jgi:hypothetical protein
MEDIITKSLFSNKRERKNMDLLGFRLPPLGGFLGPRSAGHLANSGSTCRGALAIFFASHESKFNVPSECCTMEAHRVLGHTA